MTRLINRPVDVTMGPGGVPVVFKFCGARYRVAEVLDSWVEAGRWWEQEQEQTAFRIATEGGGVFELVRDLTGQKWLLYKTYD